MFNQIAKYIVLAVLVSVPLQVSAEVISIDEVTVKIQPLAGNEFQIFFKFTLPKLPVTVNVDYAELSFGANIKQQSNTMMFEVLSRTNAESGKSFDYNSNPATARVSKGTVGLAEVTLDITQLVELWLTEGEKNDGFILVAHRRIAERVLSSDKISLAPQFKQAGVRIFYTVIE